MVEKSGAFEEVLLELLPRLRRFCFGLTGARHDADDLMQMTVERLLTKRPPDDADLAKWMFRVCRNIWIDEIRARGVRRTEEINEDTTMPAINGEKAALDKVLLVEVNAAMDRLPDEFRIVLSLVALDGCSYRAASDALGIPVGTVMSRLARARGALATMLAMRRRSSDHAASAPLLH